MRNFKKFLTEATALYATNNWFAINSSAKASIPRTLFLPADSNALISATKFTMIEFPVFKLKSEWVKIGEKTTADGRRIEQMRPNPDADYYVIPSLISAVKMKPSKENIDNLAKRLTGKKYKFKISTITKKQLLAFFIKKQITTRGLEKYFGDMSFQIHDITAKDVTETPIKVKADKPTTTAKPAKKASKSKKPEKEEPRESIPPFTIMYPPRHPDKLGLSKLLKVAVVLLKKNHIEHLFDHVMIAFATPKKSKTRGIAFGSNVIGIDPGKGLSATTLATIMHELWHWLEDRYPMIIPAMREQMKVLQARRNGDLYHAFDAVVKPSELIGRGITVPVEGRKVPAHGKIIGVDNVRNAVRVEIDPEHIHNVTARGIRTRIPSPISLPTDSVLKGSFPIDGLNVMKRPQSQWMVSKYAETNVREFGADMFSWWSTGRLKGEPAEFMSKLIASVK